MNLSSTLLADVWTNSQKTEELQHQNRELQQQQQGQVLKEFPQEMVEPESRMQKILNLIEQLPPGA